MKTTPSKTTSTACAMLAILLASTVLTGCSHASRGGADLRRLYQPTVLRLLAGSEVPTLDGLHHPQTDEIWHSDARYRDVEARLVDALAALRAQREAGR